MKNVFELIEANGLTLHGDIEHFAELRRLHELNQELVETLNIWLEQYKGEEYEDCPEVEKTRATLAKAGEKK